jgi:hypothetical protein
MPSPVTTPGYALPAPNRAPPTTSVGPPLAYARPIAPPPSIANAETVGTPKLAAHKAPSPQLSRPPGITVTPASPAATLRSADDAFEDERHGDPAEIVALRRADTTGSRDVLAGWGWSTGTLAVVDDSEPLNDAARSGRKRLLIAIGGALAGLLIIAGLAFAFSGSPPADQATALPATPTPAATAAPPPPEPSVALPTVPANPAPESANPEPAGAAVPEPASPEPPSEVAAAPPPAPVAQPPAATASEPPATATALPITPAPPPAKPQPTKIAAVKPEPPKAAPRPEPTRKLDTKQPDHKPLKRLPPERIAKAPTRGQPVDPYAAPASKMDPATAYKTGLQQYVRGDTAAALATFRASVATSPGFAPTWRGLGLVYEKQGNKAQARVAYRRYLQLAPTADDAGQIRDRMERL